MKYSRSPFPLIGQHFRGSHERANALVFIMVICMYIVG